MANDYGSFGANPGGRPGQAPYTNDEEMIRYLLREMMSQKNMGRKEWSVGGEGGMSGFGPKDQVTPQMASAMEMLQKMNESDRDLDIRDKIADNRYGGYGGYRDSTSRSGGRGSGSGSTSSGDGISAGNKRLLDGLHKEIERQEALREEIVEQAYLNKATPEQKEMALVPTDAKIAELNLEIEKIMQSGRGKDFVQAGGGVAAQQQQQQGGDRVGETMEAPKEAGYTGKLTAGDRVFDVGPGGGERVKDEDMIRRLMQSSHTPGDYPAAPDEPMPASHEPTQPLLEPEQEQGQDRTLSGFFADKVLPAALQAQGLVQGAPLYVYERALGNVLDNIMNGTMKLDKEMGDWLYNMLESGADIPQEERAKIEAITQQNMG